MKLKYIIVVYIIGMLLITAGALFKIQHWMFASEFLTAGTVIQLIAFILFIIKLLTDKNFKNILNQ